MSSDYISLYDERFLDLDEIIVPQVTTDNLNVNNDISVGGKINGVDINAVELRLKDMVDTKTNQTIGGKKTFTNELIIKHATQFPDAYLSSFVGGSWGGVTTKLLSHQDYNAEVILGSNMDGNPNASSNMKWKLLSGSGWADSEFSIERGPFYTGAGWEKMLSMRHLNPTTSEIRAYQNLHMMSKNILMQDGATVDGVDVSALAEKVDNKMVTIDTSQTINGSKTFTSNINSSNIIANGYINCNVLTSSGNVRGVNFLSTGFSQVRDANSTGQVITGMNIRSSGRAQQFFLSNGDNVSETYYGSDLNGSGTVDANQKWCISSRTAQDGRLIFYRAPFYTGNSYDPVMDFKNTLNPETKSYDCTINMHKPVNFNGSVSINGQNVSVTSYKANPDRLYWLGKFINMLDYWTTCSIQKVCNTVTMTIGAFTARHMVDGPTASWYIESNKNLSPIPVAFRPSVDLTFPVVIRVTMDNIGRVSRCIVKTDGSVWICGDVNDFTHFQGRLAFDAFSVSWVVGL